MRTPAQLRSECRAAIRAGKNEPDLYLKRSMARHALAPAQLAEKIERDLAASARSPARAAPMPSSGRVRFALTRTTMAGFRGVTSSLTALVRAVRATGAEERMPIKCGTNSPSRGAWFLFSNDFGLNLQSYDGNVR